MTGRLALGLAMCGGTLLVGLYVCCLQSENYDRARQLAELQRECELVEAANTQDAAVARAHVSGEPNPVNLTDREQEQGAWE